ncbi:MAG: four-carbon acid sugar kinase family protein [Tepidibacillus sp.]
MYFVIIADDLTGSSDSGVQFAKKGLKSSVFFNLNHLNKYQIDADVVIIDTDSRGISKEEAYNKVLEASRQLQKRDFKYLYKKIDSTLRGNIGAEINAILDIYPKDFAIIAPAYPSIGRTTLNGNHYLNGTLIHQTEIAMDPKTPVLESNIEKLLKLQTNRLSATIQLEDLRKGEAYIHSYLKNLKDNGIELLVIDIQEEEDLHRLTKYVLTSEYDVLWVGSAGLAEHLSLNSELNNQQTDMQFSKNNAPAIVVAGSMSLVTKEQIEYMKDMENISFIELNPIVLFNETLKRYELERCKTTLVNEVMNGRDVVLYVGTQPEQIAKARENGMRIGFNHIEISNFIAKSLGEIIASVINYINISGLVLTGGDTAKAVSRQIQVQGMQLFKEVENGIPLGKLIGKYEFPVVTKAGAFGSKKALFKAIKLLKGDANDE